MIVVVAPNQPRGFEPILDLRIVPDFAIDDFFHGCCQIILGLKSDEKTMQVVTINAAAGSFGIKKFGSRHRIARQVIKRQMHEIRMASNIFHDLLELMLR